MTPALDALFGSRSAAQTLLFLQNYGEGHARRIATTFDVSSHMAIQRQLRRLEAEGILVSCMVGNTRVFTWNPRSATVKNLRTFLEAELEHLPDEVTQQYFQGRQEPHNAARLDRSHLEALGFNGFIPLSDLRSSLDRIPEEPGLYVVLRTAESPPNFIFPSPAGWFKGSDRSYSQDILERKWIPGGQVIYIGKAGPSRQRTLRKRVGELLLFGAGSPIGHRGGRAIWQLSDAESCLLAWKSCSGEPRNHEKLLIADFEGIYGRIPFANFTR